jgi:3-deoxy-manno-octulosonate cytidylyltransferase (CMP-KDO synthetase)
MVLGIIPARFSSTRFPGKPLVMIQGKSMIQRVYEQAIGSEQLALAVVATDDQRIFDHVVAFGGKVVMTSTDHVSGTDRCAEVARLYPEMSFVLNIQGDEPFIMPEQIDLLAKTLIANEQCSIATLAKKIEQPNALFNINIVKVVFSKQREAIYFSRHPIPFIRDAAPDDWLARHDYFKHIGLYGFRREALLSLAQLQPSALEKAESLEQLRWMENGFKIGIGITEMETIGVDTPEDLLKFQSA